MRTPRLRLTLEVTDENVSSGNKEVTVTLIAELDKATSNNTDLKIAIISQLDDAIMHLINTANKNSNGEIITANRYNNGEIRQDGLHIMVGLVFAITPSRPSTTIDNPNTAVKWAMIVDGNEVQDWEDSNHRVPITVLALTRRPCQGGQKTHENRNFGISQKPGRNTAEPPTNAMVRVPARPYHAA